MLFKCTVQLMLAHRAGKTVVISPKPESRLMFYTKQIMDKHKMHA
jgi:hypothetical protein